MLRRCANVVPVLSIVIAMRLSNIFFMTNLLSLFIINNVLMFETFSFNYLFYDCKSTAKTGDMKVFSPTPQEEKPIMDRNFPSGGYTCDALDPARVNP